MAETTNPGQDPIDQYLATLSQVKQSIDQNMPRLQQGIDAILNDTQKSLMPNTMPVSPEMHRQLGSYAGMTNFKQPVPNIKQGSALDLSRSLIADLGVPGSIEPSTAAQLVRKVGFGNGPGRQHFDRYYNSSAYERLGWNPYMDMETHYNNNSTWSEDFGRAGKQWFGLAGLGAKQMFSNWDNLLSLDASGDSKYAAEMNRRMAIASSSRGGVGGFITNQVANSAYTMGVIGSIVVEELALAAATTASGGLGLPAALAKTGQNLNRLFKLGDFATDAATLAKAGKTVDQVSTTGSALNSIKDVSSARKFWEGIKSNAQAAYEFSKPGLNFINPLGNTADALRAYKTEAQGFAKITDFASNSGTFGAFFRDMQGLNAALAESRLEGGFVQNEVLDNLLAEHYKNAGGPPNDQQAQAMIDQAKAAGVMTVGFNMPAILYSNKIVFDKLFGGFRGFKDGANPLGTMIKNYGAKKGEKAFAGFFDKGSLSDWGTLFKSGGIARQYVKNGFRPKNLSRHGLRYMSANLTEGIQEVYQEAASKAMTDYYTNTFSSPERAGSAEFMAAIGRGIEEQFTSQGLETFASGFLMGGLVQGPQTIITQTVPQKIKDIRAKAKDPVAYAQTEKLRKEQKEGITNLLNNVAADPKKYYDAIYNNVKAQKDFATLMTEANQSGNKKAHADASQDSLFEHVFTLINKGYTDLFTDQISEYEKLSDKDLMDAFGLNKEDIEASDYRKDLRSRLKSVKDKVQDIQKRYDKYAAVQNPYNPESKNQDEQLDYRAFNEAKKAAIFNEYTFDRAESRMKSILSKAANSGLGGVVSGKITGVLSLNPLTISAYGYTQLDTELASLQKEYELYEKGTPEQKELAKQKKKQIDTLTEVKKGLDVFRYSVNASKSVNNKEVEKEIADTLHAIETVEVGDTVDYTPKKKKKINGKVVKRTKTSVTIEYTESGKTKRSTVKINGQTLSIVGKAKPSQTTLEFDPENKTTHLDFMRESFGKDLKAYLAAISGLPEDSAQLDDLVADMLDYYELSQDAEASAAFVNLMNDPKYFLKTAKILRDSMAAAYKNANDTLKEALNSYKKRADTNKILQDIFEKYQVFFLPEEIENLLSGKGIPVILLDANSLEPLDPSAPKYKEIRDYIIERTKEAGFYTEPAAEAPVEETGTKAEVKPETKEEPASPKPTKQITQDTPLGDMPTELVNNLRITFETINGDARRRGFTVIPEEDFPKWVSQDSKALAEINRYNIKNGLGLVKPKETPGKVTENVVKREIDKDSTREQVIEAINSTMNISDIQRQITDSILENTGLTPEEVKGMLNKRQKQLDKIAEVSRSLQESINFDTVKEGAAVGIDDGPIGRGKVVKINRGVNPSVTVLMIKNAQLETGEVTLSKEEFNNKFKFMINMTDYEIEQSLRAGVTPTLTPQDAPITAEEKEVSNENVKATDTEDATQLDAEADKLSDELGIDAAKQNLINKLGCKK